MENAAPLRNAPGDKPVAPIRFALVEDARELRAEILRLLLAQTGFESVGVFADGESAARDLPALHPHVVLMDIRLPGLSGVDCVRELKTRLPDTEFMMLTAFDDYDLIFQSLQAGATGYLLKKSIPGELLDAIRELRAGGSPMSASIARKVVHAFTHLDSPPWPPTRSPRASRKSSAPWRAANSTKKWPRNWA